MEALSGVIEAHPEDVEAHPVDMVRGGPTRSHEGSPLRYEAPAGSMKAHPIDMEVHPRAIEAYPV
jgi:hypothetical protein